ncbi:MAG: DNA polymerase III subunit delta [Pseudomonadota bacterium]
MKLTTDKLASHLEGDLQAVYLVSGDEPLLVMEACDAIRRAARGAGFSERTTFTTGRSFDWHQLLAEGASLSLFAERRMIELRLASAKPGKAGEKAIVEYLDAGATDTLLLVVAPRLDRNVAKASWVKALESAGGHLAVWPPQISELPAWISQRLRSRGFQASAEATALIADRVEGNLLAAAQEVEKLALLHAPGTLADEAVREAVADSARYDVFSLADAALAAQGPRALRVLDGLRAEGTDPTLVLWAVTRELRTLASIAYALATGGSQSQAMRGVWPRRQQLLGGAAKRITLPGVHRLLKRANYADEVVKGARPGVEPWPVVTDLVARISGVAV